MECIDLVIYLLYNDTASNLDWEVFPPVIKPLEKLRKEESLA
jgi:hypothetical protein